MTYFHVFHGSCLKRVKISQMRQGGKLVFLKRIEASTFARKLEILSPVPTCLAIHIPDVFSTKK